MPQLTTIGFDADDTLWQTEAHFRLTQTRFAGLLADHADPDHLSDRLLAAERRNLGHYGFGVKGFMLSMIETAIEVTDGRVEDSLVVTSRKEVGLFPEQLRLHFVPVLHRLQWGFAAQG